MRGNCEEDDLQHYFNMFAKLDFDGFSSGWRMEDMDAHDEDIWEAFDYADRNYDGYVGFRELKRMVKDWELMEDDDDHEGRRQRGRDRRDNDDYYTESGREEEEMSADDYWYMFAEPGEEWMSYDGFARGYNHAEPGVDQGTIDEAWNHGDANGDGWMDYEEFMNLVEGMEEQYEHEDYMDASDYWYEATSNHERGMSRREFSELYQEHDDEVTTQEIREAFRDGDENGDNRLDLEEFEDLVEDMEEHEEEHDGPSAGELWW